MPCAVFLATDAKPQAKRVLQKVRHGAFPFQIPVAYVVFKVIEQLLTSSSLSSRPFLSFNGVF
jgi:hypothetical protein